MIIIELCVVSCIYLHLPNPISRSVLGFDLCFCDQSYILMTADLTGPMGWIKRQMDLGIGPRDILTYMAPQAKVVS